MNRKVTIFSAVVAASLISGSLVYATTVTSSKVTACADKKTGILRAATRCKSSEKSVPLISGSVQLAPVYTDANKKPINVVGSGFDRLGEVSGVFAIVNGKYVNVDGVSGKVYPIGSTRFSWMNGNPFYYLQSDCSGTPFLWFSNSSIEDQDARNLYANLMAKKNYAGYFVLTVNGSDSYLKITDAQTAFADGVALYQHSPYDGSCARNTQINNGESYAVSGHTTIALQTFTGTRIPDFRGPITVAAQ